MQKEAAEVQGKQQKEEIKAAVREAIEEGFPTDLEEREAFFMQQIAQGEQLASEGRHCEQLLYHKSNLKQAQIRLALRCASTRASRYTPSRHL